MIFGAIYPSQNHSIPFQNKLQLIRRLMHSPDLEFFSLNCPGFKGGFFNHPNLPLEKDDFIFYDVSDDIFVMMSGNIFNKHQFIQNNKIIKDPEFVAKLFLEKGPSFVNLLNGDFAIFIYRPGKNLYYLIRDHLGVQPLAYFFDGSVLVFSSDMFNLCRAFSEEEKINFEPLLSHVKVADHLETLDFKIKKVTPGHYIEYSKNKLYIKKYWFPEKIRTNHHLNYKTILDDLEFLLIDAISKRTDSKFKAAAHLSGGIDSSYVAVLAKKHAVQKDFWGISWSPKIFKNNYLKNDERLLVTEIAKMADIQPLFLDLKISDYKDYTNRYFETLGYFWEEKTREFAKRKKINLIFSGWGGDEFISVSDSGINLDLFLNLNWSYFFKRNPVKHPRKILGVLLKKVIFPFFGWLDYDTKKSFQEEMSYFKKEYRKNNLTKLRLIYKYRARRERQIGFIYNYHISERCERWAIQGFKQGLLYRYPLLDKRIIEYILQVPSKFLFRNQKTRIILRDLSKDFLPEEVRWNETKLDYILFQQDADLLKNLGESLQFEIKYWKENPDLQLVDFNVLERDLDFFQKNRGNQKYESFLRKIIFIKMLHEFTKTYRSLPEGFQSDEAGETHNLNTNVEDDRG